MPKPAKEPPRIRTEELPVVTGFQPGDAVSASAFVNLTAVQNAYAYIVLLAFDDESNYLAGFESTVRATRIGKTRLVVEGCVLPAGTAALRLTLGFGTTEAIVPPSEIVGGEWEAHMTGYWDAAMIENRPVVGPYRDGSFPNWDWSSTAHESASALDIASDPVSSLIVVTYSAETPDPAQVARDVMEVLPADVTLTTRLDSGWSIGALEDTFAEDTIADFEAAYTDLADLESTIPE